MTPPEIPSQTRGRALAHLLAYVVLALPGAFSVVRGCDAAPRGTLERVNAEKAREVAGLQSRVKTLRNDLDRLAAASEERTQRLRGELRRTREELSRALLDVALRRGGRGLRARLERADAAPAALPALPRATRLPALRRPTRSLEQVEAAAK